MRALGIRPVSKNDLYAPYACSLGWVVVLVAIAVGLTVVVMISLTDFVHHNPYRSLEDTVVTTIALAPIMALLGLVQAVLVFTLPQCFQALVSYALMRVFGSRAHTAAALALPITALITWYCYDHLVPDDHCLVTDGPDCEPFQHGLTAVRYLEAIAAQTPVSLFATAYASTTNGSRSRKVVMRLALAGAIAAGVIWGHHIA